MTPLVAMAGWAGRCRGRRGADDGQAPDERGSALVEFVFLAVVLLVPVIYLVLTVGRLQAASHAVGIAAREGGRAFVSAATRPAASARADAAAALAFGDFGFEGGRVQVRCQVDPCLTPDARVDVDAEIDVPLPLVPAFVRDVVPSSVRVRATYGVTVDRFGGLRR